ncbi:MAG: hypothetical protein INR73_26840 [Williamsia sp.]|nr:hypothetical protein [Williamsia sp.]
MKKLLIVLFSLSVGLGASAQFKGHIAGGGARIVRPQVIIGGYVPYVPFNPYMGYGYGFGYGLNPYYGFPPYSNRASRPSKLDLQVEDIRHDYKDRIWSVKHDKSLSRQERKDKVKELKHEREDAISDAKRNYYKTKPDYRSQS